MKKGDMVMTVHPRIGERQQAEIMLKPQMSGLTQADREPTVLVKFADGYTVEQPLWTIDE